MLSWSSLSSSPASQPFLTIIVIILHHVCHHHAHPHCPPHYLLILVFVPVFRCSLPLGLMPLMLLLRWGGRTAECSAQNTTCLAMPCGMPSSDSSTKPIQHHSTDRAWRSLSVHEGWGMTIRVIEPLHVCVLNSRFTKLTSLQVYHCSPKRSVLMASLVTFAHGNLQQMYWHLWTSFPFNSTFRRNKKEPTAIKLADLRYRYDMTIRSDIPIGKTRDSVVVKRKGKWCNMSYMMLHVSFVMPDGTVTTQPSKQKVVRKPCGFQGLAGNDRWGAYNCRCHRMP